MMPALPTPLPRFDRWMLGAVATLVPADEREEWMRTWQAELWHLHDRRPRRGLRGWVVSAEMPVGLTRDACWLRTDRWRRTYAGTAALCLASVAGCCLLAGLIGFLLCGSVAEVREALWEPGVRTVFAAPLVLFVSFATASRRPVERGSTVGLMVRVKRRVFFAVKAGLVLVLAFLLSVDVCQPIFSALPNTAELLQVFSFVLLALVGLRWAFRDQEQRCKQCLHALATPARVGRPSHNLLEWNGTELSCRHGHGLLSVPEMETSWCESSRWVELDRGWDEAASA
jgi:hypothetical protein